MAPPISRCPTFNPGVAIGAGQGAGLSLRDLGEIGGEESVTLASNQIPGHTHPAQCNSGTGTAYGPAGEVWATDAGGNNEYGPGPIAGQMSSNTVLPFGAGQPHNNLQPYLVLNYCIALQGIFPSRS